MFHSLYKAGMQSQPTIDADMRARVAIGSIYAAKVTDRMMMPERGDSAGGALQFVSDRPMHLVAHADLKDSDVGTSSTFLAATHYTEEAKKRRDELLAKYKDHETTA